MISPSRAKLLLILSGIVVGSAILAGAHFFPATTDNQVGAEAVSEPRPTPTTIGPGYEWYTPETLAQAQMKGRTFLLFWVPWCSSCSALDIELEKRSNELPTNVTVIKINMDQDKTLATQYGVSIQHTLVEIDSQGNEIQKWVGGDFNTLTTHL